ncbi:MAG TPA: hypothetical protein VHK64_08570 [Nocardioidaceae bacterium]|jgi:hypothetical protein|nr:hypothetical protein [Nocardioidaceae bacterium]
MTQIDGHATRRRWNWSARNQGNRIFYALVLGWVFWLATGHPSAWLILAVGAAVYAVETAFFLIRAAYPGTDRKL